MADTRAGGLLGQLQETQRAVDGLTSAVEELAGITRRNRLWTIVLGVTLALTLAVGGFVVWFAISTRSDLRDFGERLFLNSCEDTNEARAAGNEGRTRQAETLIEIFNADERAPDLAAQYREQTAQINADFPQRDCAAELQAAA